MGGWVVRAQSVGVMVEVMMEVMVGGWQIPEPGKQAPAPYTHTTVKWIYVIRVLGTTVKSK